MDIRRQTKRRGCHLLERPRATATRGWRREEWTVVLMLLSSMVVYDGELAVFLLLPLGDLEMVSWLLYEGGGDVV
jgi:hypothetical protein